MATHKITGFFYLFLLSCSVVGRDLGNKTENLIKTRDIVKQYLVDNSEPLVHESGIPYQIAVPDFLGIGNREVQTFLNKQRFSFEGETASALHLLNAEWEKFKKYFTESQGELSEQAKSSLENIRSIIRRAFLSNFELSETSRRRDLESFLKDAKAHQKRLMVRSTGKEDTKELANAGGNESIPAVKPDVEDARNAMMRVINSYFSEKSFAQRVTSKDRGILDNPFMPVLLQVMIEEKVGAEKPLTSGVMFSREPYGNTQHVMAINSTFGHGEAVVNSIFPTDTFYLGGRDNPIHPVIRIKHSRKVPSQTLAELLSVRNPENIQKKPSLNEGQIRRLYHFAGYLEKKFGNSVDVEFVADDKIIYIVQVRPIVESLNRPSYLDANFVNAVSEDRKVDFSTIVSGGSAVQIINNVDDVVVAGDIKAALDDYLFNKSQIRREATKLVLVGENAPITSHEASLFRANDKTTVFSKDLQKAEAILNLKEGVVLADVQRGLMLRNTPGLPYENAIKYGWISHPIPNVVSVSGDFLPKKPTIVVKISEDLQGKSLSELYDIIGHDDDYSKSLSAISHLAAVLRQRIDSEKERQEGLKKQGLETNRDLIIQLEAIYRHFLAAAEETRLAIVRFESSPKTESDELQKLYPLVFLKALVSQVPNDPEIVLQFSIGYLFKAATTEARLADILKLQEKPSRGYVVQLAKLGKYALTEEILSNYRDFLTSFEDVSLKREFIEMVHELAQNNVLAPWLNLNFGEFRDRDADWKAMELVAIHVQDHALITKSIEMIKAARNFPIAEFEQPMKFNGLKKEFEESVLKFAEDKDFFSNYQTASALGKLIAINAIGVVVSQFDLALKNLSRSKFYEETTVKALNLALFLNPYLKLLQSLVDNLLNDRKIEEALMSRKRDSVQTYLQQTIPGLINESLARAQASNEEAIIELLPSPRFNVGGAKFGSGADWDRSIGSESGNKPTLEDLFSLIHQNLLVILGQLTKISGILAIQTSPLLKETLKQALDGFGLLKPELLGLAFERDKLVFFYNQTLRNHSATFQIKYDFVSQQISLAVQFIGDARDRWAVFANLAQLFSEQNKGALVLITPPKLDENRGFLEIEWRITDEPSMKVALATFFTLAQYTIAGLYDDMIDSIIGFAHQQGIEFSLKEIRSRALELLPSNPRMVNVILIYEKFQPGINEAYMAPLFENFPSLLSLDVIALSRIFASIYYNILEPITKEDYEKFIAHTKMAHEIKLALYHLGDEIDRLQNLDHNSLEYRTKNLQFKGLSLELILLPLISYDDEVLAWAKQKFKFGQGKIIDAIQDAHNNIKWFNSARNYAKFIVNIMDALTTSSSTDEELLKALEDEILRLWETFFDRLWLFVLEIIEPTLKKPLLKPRLLFMVKKRDLVKDVLEGLKSHNLTGYQEAITFLDQMLSPEQIMKIINGFLSDEKLREDDLVIKVIADLWARNSIEVPNLQDLLAPMTFESSTVLLSDYLIKLDKAYQESTTKEPRLITNNDIEILEIAVNRSVAAYDNRGKFPDWVKIQLSRNLLKPLIDKLIDLSEDNEFRLAALKKMKLMIETEEREKF